MTDRQKLMQKIRMADFAVIEAHYPRVGTDRICQTRQCPA